MPIQEGAIAEEIRRAREEGIKQGATDAKLELLLAGNDKIHKSISQLFAEIKPIQQDAQRALDGLIKAQADILENKARISRLEENRAKVADIDTLEKRVEATEKQAANFEGRAALVTIAVGAMCTVMGGVIGFILQQVILTGVR